VLDKRRSTIQQMFTEIAPRYDRANRLLSMRFDLAWRRRVARGLLPSPGRVLDLAAGTGDLTADLIHYGGHRVVSADFTFAMLLHGRAKLAGAGAPPQVAADALELPFRSGVFDGVTVAFGVRNFADPVAGLREARRVLREGGRVAILEFSRPRPPLGPIYQMYFHRILPRIGGWITGSRRPYEYLPASVRDFPEGSDFLALMRSAGFSEAQSVRLSGGIVTFYMGEAR
jgi:demethylmenaquinone methyltransferase/2-methoxy-6-polyprenyl-1,4-benzoquinol methylase